MNDLAELLGYRYRSIDRTPLGYRDIYIDLYTNKYICIWKYSYVVMRPSIVMMHLE